MKKLYLFVIIVILGYISCSNSDKSKLSELSKKIHSGDEFNKLHSLDVSVIDDTLTFYLTDTTKFPDTILNELRFAAILLYTQEYFETFEHFKFEYTLTRYPDYLQTREFNKLDLTNYFALYDSNAVFTDFTFYMVSHLNSFDMQFLNNIIFNMNEYFEGFNYNRKFIDLVLSYTEECKDKKQDFATKRMEAIGAFLRFSNSDNDIAPKETIKYMMDYCNLPSITDTTIVPFELKKQVPHK